MKPKILMLTALIVASTASAEDVQTTPTPPDECGQERHYPPMAIRLGHEGTTILAFRIGVDGLLTDIRVAQSSGHQELDDAAVAGARCWRYKPAMKDGKPIEAPWQASVKWQLRGGNTWLDRLFQ